MIFIEPDQPFVITFDDHHSTAQQFSGLVDDAIGISEYMSQPNGIVFDVRIFAQLSNQVGAGGLGALVDAVDFLYGSTT